ncbi:hypothetical protein BZA77DRAFT_309999 [Pyronema omphalodes]|nr:hypothetical protein BZA77DRAFT_309999 [Pyronema omphalodes]
MPNPESNYTRQLLDTLKSETITKLNHRLEKLNIWSTNMPVEILGIVTLAVTVITTAVTYADKVSSAPEEQHLAKILIDTIDDMRTEVIDLRNRYGARLSPAQTTRIDNTIKNTGDLVSATRKLLAKAAQPPMGEFIGGVMWVLKDKDRVESQKEVLLFLHGSLNEIHGELRALRCAECDDTPPRYEEIYSANNKEMLMMGLTRLAAVKLRYNQEVYNQDYNQAVVLPEDLGRRLSEDLRKYISWSEESKSNMAREALKRRTESMEAKKMALAEGQEVRSTSPSTQDNLAKEARRRYKERRMLFKNPDPPVRMVSTRTKNNMLAEARLQLANRSRVAMV